MKRFLRTGLLAYFFGLYPLMRVLAHLKYSGLASANPGTNVYSYSDNAHMAYAVLSVLAAFAAKAAIDDQRKWAMWIAVVLFAFLPSLSLVEFVLHSSANLNMDWARVGISQLLRISVSAAVSVMATAALLWLSTSAPSDSSPRV